MNNKEINITILVTNISEYIENLAETVFCYFMHSDVFKKNITSNNNNIKINIYVALFFEITQSADDTMLCYPCHVKH